jgi:Calcineurin-like phosphoesterase
LHDPAVSRRAGCDYRPESRETDEQQPKTRQFDGFPENSRGESAAREVTMRRPGKGLATVALLLGWALTAAGIATLPNVPDSVKFAVIGDNGTGDDEQYEIADQMRRTHALFRFDLVIMMGDNFYGSQKPNDLVKKFDEPYKPLLDAGVVFRAALGNHDEPHTMNYPPLNMNGQRYYTFAKKNVRFFVLDTNRLDRVQLQWAEEALASSREEWKICYFHHPLYSNAGRHGSAVDIRVLLEPLLVKHGVRAVFSGHDHNYERIVPQQGIHYFVSGAGGKLRAGDVKRTSATAAYFDTDRSFMVVEVAGPQMFFEAISRTGATVDSGVIPLVPARVGTIGPGGGAQ